MSSTGTVYRADYIPSNDLGNAFAESFFIDSLSNVAHVRLQTDGQFTNRRFTLYAAGRVVTTANLNFTLNVYLGTTKTTADTLIFSSGAQIVNNRKTNWHIDANMFWDGDSKRINGNGEGQVDNAPIGAAGLANIAIIDPNLHNVSNSFQALIYKFSVTGTFSGSSAGSHAFLDVLEIALI